MSTLPPTVLAAITRFDVSAQEYAFKGSAEPERRTAIIHRHEKAREALIRTIEKAISK